MNSQELNFIFGVQQADKLWMTVKISRPLQQFMNSFQLFLKDVDARILLNPWQFLAVFLMRLPAAPQFTPSVFSTRKVLR